MFKKLLGRKKKNQEVPAGGKYLEPEEDAPASIVAPTDLSFESDDSGLRRATSLELLADSANMKSRELSMRSQARLDVVRWRSNLNCKDTESQLVPEENHQGYGISKSQLTIAKANEPEGPVLGEVEIPRRRSHGHFSHRPSSPCPEALTRPKSILGQMRKESILNIERKEKKVPQQTRFVAPLDEDETIMDEQKQERTAMFKWKPKAKPKPEPVPPPKKKTRFRLFGRGRGRDNDSDEEDELPDDTFLGMCFDTSCVWMFGEPTEVLDCFDCMQECGNENDVAKAKEEKVEAPGPVKAEAGDGDSSVGSSRSGSRRKPRFITFPFRRSRSTKSQNCESECLSTDD